MKRKISVVLSLVLLLLVLAPLQAFAAVGDSFTCYGKDLNTEQYSQVLSLLGTDLQNDTLISVSIEDEKALLSGIVEESYMGSRSLSSARVTIAEDGAGISVSTHNINWVTANMYASALSTAGVENAKIVVAAPFEVSGTAALAGIFKAYESATNTVLGEVAKAVACEELVTLAELAQTIGADEAEELIAMLKQFIAENDLSDPTKAREAVDQACTQMNITLTEDQKQQVANLLMRFNEMDLDPAKVAEQLNALGKSIQQLQNVQQATTNFFDKVKTTFQGVVNWFKGLFS